MAEALTDYQALIAHWRLHPEDFVTQALGATPQPWQHEALRALVEHDRVSVRSCHGVGKSALDSWAILWFMCTHYPCKLGAIAPTQHQLQDVLFSELGLWHGKLPPPLRDQFVIRNSAQELRFYNRERPAESFCAGRTGRKENPEALQGFHSENMMMILDEASGIDDILFQVGEGALSTPGAKILMTSNPTRTSGYFFDSHHRMRDQWYCMKVSHEDSEFVTDTYVANMKLQYGEDSNVYRVRVLGEFPSSDDDTVIPLDLVEAATTRNIERVADIRPVWGLDVARYGNCRTALAKRQGNSLIEPVKSWHKRDLMEVAGIVQAEYEDTPSDQVPAEILVDSVGLGAGVVDRLREMALPVRGVQAGERASGRDRFSNLKAELWWRARDWFDTREVTMPNDDALIGQLVSVRYKYLSTGKIQIESKEDMMKRGVKSPDEADAFVLTFAGGTRRFQEQRYTVRPKQRRKSFWTR